MGKLIVGLGNPGREYGKNRHNVGFMAVDEIAKTFEFDNFKEEKKFEAELAQGEISGEKVLLAKPLTFMNKSGEAVRKIVDYFKIDKKDLILIFDDIDLPLGSIRIREKGGAGTHNGMKSVTQALGTDEFPRIKIGTESRGDSAPKKQETSSFVLSDFTKEEEGIIRENLGKMPKIIGVLLRDGTEAAMTNFNSS